MFDKHESHPWDTIGERIRPQGTCRFICLFGAACVAPVLGIAGAQLVRSGYAAGGVPEAFAEEQYSNQRACARDLATKRAIHLGGHLNASYSDRVRFGVDIAGARIRQSCAVRPQPCMA